MEQFMQLQTAWMVFIGVCASVIAVGGATAVIARWVGKARKPTEENAATIEQMMDYFAADKRRIEALERRQDEQDEESKLVLKALMQLMSHEIDGNHKAQLAAVRDEVQEFLIER